MKKNGILTGKKLILGTVLSSVVAMNAIADYKLILIDKDGVQTSKCIQSYSFSNNLESIVKQQNMNQDIYSTSETLTNKVYMGKPVYRKVIEINNVQENTNYSHNITNIDQKVNAEYQYLATANNVLYNFHNRYNHYTAFNETTVYVSRFGTNLSTLNLKLTAILEYTKTIDTTSVASREFKSYLHYVSSASTNGNVTTKDLKNIGVQFLEDYTYDSSTNSCVKN